MNIIYIILAFLPTITVIYLISDFAYRSKLHLNEGYKFFFKLKSNSKLKSIQYMIIFLLGSVLALYIISILKSCIRCKSLKELMFWLIASLILYMILSIIFIILKKLYLLFEKTRNEKLTLKIIIVFVAVSFISLNFDLFQQLAKNHMYYVVICLSCIYILNLNVLFTAMADPLNLCSKNSNDKKYVWFNAIIIILLFIIIFYIGNRLINLAYPLSYYVDSHPSSLGKFDTFYYTISMFLTFCCDSATPYTKYSQLLCTISRVTTVLFISIFLNVLLSIKTDSIKSKSKTKQHSLADQSIRYILAMKFKRIIKNTNMEKTYHEKIKQVYKKKQ